MAPSWLLNWPEYKVKRLWQARREAGQGVRTSCKKFDTGTQGRRELSLGKLPCDLCVSAPLHQKKDSITSYSYTLANMVVCVAGWAGL